MQATKIDLRFFSLDTVRGLSQQAIVEDPNVLLVSASIDLIQADAGNGAQNK